MSQRRHRLRLGATAIAALVVAAFVPGGIVRAHAIVDSVVPADGSALVESPQQIVFTFSEPMLADGIAVEVTSTA